jgi:glycosyltransferase involved in cell wall biosynthesis
MRIAMIGSRGVVNTSSGIETVLQCLCPRLVSRGHHITVFGDQNNVGSFEGVCLRSVPALNSKHLETLSRSFCSTLLALSSDFDVIHFHDVAPALWSGMTRIARRPTVLTLHSLDWKRAKWSAVSQSGIRFIEKIAVRRVDRIAVVSQSLQDYLRKEYGLASEVLPNAVEPLVPVPAGAFSARLGLAPRKFILFAGRLVREKALHDLIQAYKASGTDMKLVIAGESRHGTSYEREIRAMAQNTGTLFAGLLTREQLQELYSNAALFVLPSYVEGRSMALLEALAHRTPVLVSDIPENLELVSHEPCTFKAGDVVDLTARLSQLLRKPVQARSSAPDTDWNKIVSGYERIYRELVP